MSAAATLARARAAGLVVTTDGRGLRLRGPEPTADLLTELRAHKAALLNLLASERGPPELIKPPPSWWRDNPHEPAAGGFCACCWRSEWWTRDRLGWCCMVCHPPDHLTPDSYTVSSTASPQQRQRHST